MISIMYRNNRNENSSEKMITIDLQIEIIENGEE